MSGKKQLALSLSLVLFAWASVIGKPNIIFIISDDQSYETIGYAGMTDVKTPNLDRLANRGTYFPYAYNMGSWSGAICIASRTMLNTGRTVHRANSARTSNAQSWGGIMNSGGYTTYFTGKWHVSKVSTAIYNVKGTVRGGMPSQTKAGYNRPKDTTDPYKEWCPWDKKHGGFWKGGTHWSEIVADDAVKFINQAKTKDDPFFMHIAFNAPHDPRQSPQEFVEMYPYKQVKVPEDFKPTFLPLGDLKKLGIDAGLRDENLAPFPRTEFAVQVNRQEYYAIITHMDQQIGRILDALESSGKQDSTYVIFTSDHGLACGHHGLIGKQNMFDHSLRVPWIIAGPGIPQKETNNAKIYLQDAMATAIDVAGITKPAYVEFNSVMPLINGTKEKHYEEIYGYYRNSMRAIIKGDYKFIYYPPINRAMLFNLREDSSEMNDLIASPTHAAVIDTCWEAFKALETQMGKTPDYSYKPPAISGPQEPMVGAITAVRQSFDNRRTPISHAGKSVPSNYSVYTLSGKLVGVFANDRNEVRWNGTTLSGTAVKSGIYFVRFGDQVARHIVR